MKTNFLWLMVFTFSGLVGSAQVTKNFSNDPVAQLRSLIELPKLEMPSVKMPKLPGFSNKPAMPVYDLKKTIENAKALCPLLKPGLSLEGDRNSNVQVGLQWKIANTVNRMAFDVERSLGDTLHFQAVNFVWAKESALKNKYELPDDNDYRDVSYYRIKMILSDGKFVYSNIAAVKGYETFLFAVYPNPSPDKVWITLSSKTEGVGNVALYNTDGKMMLQHSASLVKGYNQQNIDITRLPAGTYMIKATLPDKQVRIEKLIKN